MVRKMKPTERASPRVGVCWAKETLYGNSKRRRNDQNSTRVKNIQFNFIVGVFEMTSVQ